MVLILIYIHACTHTYVHIHTYIRACMHACIHMNTYTCMNIYIQTSQIHPCMHAYAGDIYIHTHAYILTCINIYTYIHTYRYVTRAPRGTAFS